MQARALVVSSKNLTPRTIRKGEEFGPLIVISPRRKEGQFFVHTCQCRCGSANCPTYASFDEVFLSDTTNFTNITTDCFFASRPSLVSFADLRNAVHALKLSSESAYSTALNRGRLPKGSPIDPTTYPEWTSWGDLLGNPTYFSRGELSAVLGTLDMESFAMIPELERYRFLARQTYWNALQARAQENGITVNALLSDPELLQALMGGDQVEEETPTSGVGGGSSSFTPRPRATVPELDFEHFRSRMEWSANAFQSVDQDIFQEVMTGWLHEIWNKVDQYGPERVEAEYLTPTENTSPTCKTIATKFREQLAEVSVFKVNRRNWMQAYSLWYSTNNLRWVNWSEPGLGKTRTVPATVAHLDLRLTVFIAPMKIIMETNEQFAKEVREEDDRAMIHYCEHGLPAHLEPGFHHYILLNPTLFQLGARSTRMVNRLLEMAPDMVIFDEAHLISSKAGTADAEALSFEEKPRTRELNRFTSKLPTTTRVGLLTGTPIRTSALEAQSLLGLLGIEVAAFGGDLNYPQAFALRAKLQQYGFRFYNYVLPVFEQYVVPFEVPNEVAMLLNSPGRSYLENEAIRIPYAMAALRESKRRETLKFDGNKYTPCSTDFDPVTDSVNPVVFTTFVDGPVASIHASLKKVGLKAYECTGQSEGDQYTDFVKNKDRCLIASQAFSTGLDGAHKVSDTLITVSMPWTYTSHKQLIARLVRQGAVSPVTGETPIIREFIPVAKNVGYDVRRFQTVSARREFSDCMLDGKLAEEMKRPEDELHAAFLSVLGENPHELTTAA